MGRMLGAVDSRYCAEVITYNYIATLATTKFFVAPNPCVVTDIRGIPTTLGTGGACTLQIFKAPSGTAIASGTLLHSGSYNLVGTIDTNQVLTLVSNSQGTLNLNTGDSLGFVLTGTATSAIGMIQVTTEPL